MLLFRRKRVNIMRQLRRFQPGLIRLKPIAHAPESSKMIQSETENFYKCDSEKNP